MKTVVIIFCTFLVLPTWAQSGQFGLCFQNLNASGTDIRTFDPGSTSGYSTYSVDFKNENVGVVGIYGGYYYPLIKLNRKVWSAGFEAQARLLIWVDAQKEERYTTGQIASPGSSSVSSEAQLLILPTISFGKLSSKEDSHSDYGCSLGFGGKLNTFSYSIVGLSADENGSAIKPVTKLSFAYKDFVLGIDYVYSPYQSYYRGNVSDIPRVKLTNQIGVTIGFSF